MELDKGNGANRLDDIMEKGVQQRSLDHVIYVLDKDGMPLRPMSSPARARKKIESGKAEIVCYEPFTIQLTYDLDPDTLDVPDLILGIDDGVDHIGFDIVDDNGLVYLSGKVRTRTQQIPKLMKDRYGYRHNRRSKEKAVRNRREVQEAKKRGEPNPKVRRIHRILPGCDKAITCHVTINTQARFNNRTRPDGWLTPTANQLLQTHLNLVKVLSAFCPIGEVSLEVAKFDIALMEENGDRDKVDYKHGPLSGYKGVEDAVRDQQDGVCLLCGKNAIDHYHHIVPQSKDGADTIGNIAGLCSKCHDKIHKDANLQARLAEKKEGYAKKYRAASLLNQIMPRLIEGLAEFVPHVTLTTGQDTKKMREKYDLPKDHHIDAWCIACAALDEEDIRFVPESFSGSARHDIMQFRRHDRQRTRRITDRKYLYNGKVVAKNRHRRTGQDNPADISLEEFAREHPELVSKLTVKPASHVYNNRKRMLPGAVFLYKGKRYVSFGCQSNGSRFTSPLLEKGYVSVNECRVVDGSPGLVFLGVTLEELEAARVELKESRKNRRDARVADKQNAEMAENLEIQKEEPAGSE